MTLSADGWVSWATPRSGPADKIWPQTNRRQGIVLHSMEGWITGSLAELDKPERHASWHFSLQLGGTLLQHYPLSKSCWASGNEYANTTWVALELEGIQSMPINDAQLRTLLRLLHECDWLKPGDNIREHRRVATIIEPNGGPTACPSERYAPLYAALKEEEDMTTDQINALIDQRIRDKQNRGDLASTTDVLSCIAQIVGVDTLTYTDKEKVDAVREAIAQMGNQE